MNKGLSKIEMPDVNKLPGKPKFAPRKEDRPITPPGYDKKRPKGWKGWILDNSTLVFIIICLLVALGGGIVIWQLR